MNVEITGRHIEITQALREFATEKLQKLTRLLDGPLDVHVVLGIEKHRHIAEIQVKSRAGVFSSAHETGDLYTSISDVAEKLERQAQKHKEKLQHHKHRKGPRDPETAAAIEEAAAEATAKDGRPAGEATPPRTGPCILRTRGSRMKPCSPEEALLDLESSGRDILLFREIESGKLHVIYRRGDGNFGLIESKL